MKYLISWIGFNEDFEIRGERFVEKTTGFTISLHRDVYHQLNFTKHIVLCTTDRSGKITKQLDQKKGLLNSFVAENFPKHKIDFIDTGIDKSDLQNFNVIESSLRSLLQRFDASIELHVVAGTGPTAVGMAWCTLNLAMRKRFFLHVLQRPEYVPNGKISTLKKIDPFINQQLDDALREHHFSLNLPSEIFHDEIVEEEYKRAYVYSQATDMNILILGETGCGKDKLAQYIVSNSPLSGKTYKAINCASIPDEVLYSELFGHVKGSFTDAKSDRIGLFEECNGGTLFLDELGDISKFMQQSLLRAIENKEIKKLGTNQIINDVQVRIIAATNNNLYEKCKIGEFRWDLYYRLSSPEIVLQSYRNRPELARKKVISHYIKMLEKKWGRKISFEKQAQQILEKYNFPGNFREIYNTLNALFPLNLKEIKPENLPDRFRIQENTYDESYESVLKNHCVAIYKKYNYNLSATKKALKYSNVTQLKEKLINWGVYRDYQ